MGILECEKMTELSLCTLHRRKSLLDEGRCSWASREDQWHVLFKMKFPKSNEPQQGSLLFTLNSLLFTCSMYSVWKCYFLNVASASTSTMKNIENCGVKKLASILVNYKDTTINSSVLTSTPFFFGPAKNIFMLSFFLLSQKQQWFWLYAITIISNTKKLNHNGSNVNKALEEAKGSVQLYSKGNVS